MKRRNLPGARAAFTIVELLVAMALIIFIMYILAEAFAAGTTAFRNLKAVGDMNERLRSATATLRRYLQADHFDGRRRLSDVDFWKNGPPQEGFFRIVQSNLSNVEGNDLDGVSSAQCNTQALHFAVKLRGNNRADFFRASVPNGGPNASPLLLLPFPDSRFQDTSTSGLICSPAAEVAFFLRDSGVLTDDPDSVTGNSPQRLFTMHFRQRLLVPDNEAVKAVGLANTPTPLWPVPYNQSPNFKDNWKNYLEVSAIQDPTVPPATAQLYFNNLQDVTMPARRWGQYVLNAGAIQSGSLPGTSLPNLIGADGTVSVSAGNGAVYPRLADEDPNQAGNDVLLTDVLSWHTSVLLDSNAYALFTQANAPATAKMPPSTPRPVEFIELTDDMITSYMPFTSLSSTPPNDPNGPSPFQASPLAPRIFDTWSSRRDDAFDYSGWDPRPVNGTRPFVTGATIPMFEYRQPNLPTHPLNGTLIRIRAIKITLRIWDSKTKQTRMTSVIVDL